MVKVLFFMISLFYEDMIMKSFVKFLIYVLSVFNFIICTEYPSLARHRERFEYIGPSVVGLLPSPSLVY